MKRACVILMCIGVATAALAHTGVKNAAVKARMDGMSRLAAHAKVLGTGLRTGASQADMTAAAAALRHEAGTIATLFMPQEDDPKSEARAAIWANWSDFQARSDVLVEASALAQAATTPAELDVAFRQVGAACSACHKVYRD